MQSTSEKSWTWAKTSKRNTSCKKNPFFRHIVWRFQRSWRCADAWLWHQRYMNSTQNNSLSQSPSTLNDYKTIICSLLPESYCWHAVAATKAILTQNTSEQILNLTFVHRFFSPTINSFSKEFTVLCDSKHLFLNSEQLSWGLLAV